MLQSLRDNLKGTIAVIVIAIFAVPMVLFGVERLFVGSLGGNDVASVGDTTISRTELNRAIYLQKQRILSQMEVDPNSEFLKDENLRGPVLENLIREAALVNAAKDGGMTVSEAALWQQIAQQPEFQSDEGFDQQRFRQLVNNMGFTTATYLEALADGLIAEQQTQGVTESSFMVEEEIDRIVAIAQQTRSFFSIRVPNAEVAENVNVTDEDIAAYYENNQSRFRVPEQVALNYLEIGLDTLAERQEVEEADIRAQFEQELAEFDAQPRVEISHILIEEGEDSQQELEQVQSALAEGQGFAEVAREYSDDLGTRDSGGYLGFMIEDAFPEAFAEAVQALDEGEISAPVTTEAGTHLIKVESKIVPDQPQYADRRDEIERALRQSLAQQEMATLRERLDELTYSASDLQEAAAELNLDVQSTDLLPRTARSGLLSYPAVKEAAFSTDVLEEGHNSRVLELPDQRLVVLRVTQHEPERVQPLADVRGQVEQQVREAKTAEALAELANEIEAEIAAGNNPQTVAQERGFEYSEQSQVARSDAEVDRNLRERLFSMPRPAGERPVVQSFTSNGDRLVLALTEVQEGSRASLDEAQLTAMRNQLSRQQGSFEAQAYEDALVAAAEIETE